MSVTVISLPFQGFCDSPISDEIDSLEEQAKEYYSYGDAEEIHEPDWNNYFIAICKAYVASYNEAFKEDTGISLDAEFKELWHPREYNFELDKIYVSVKTETLQSILQKIEQLNINLKEKLRDHYKPTSGFSPFTSTLEAIEKPFQEYKKDFWGDVILELLFKSEMIYNDDSFNTTIREAFYQN